MNSSASSQAKEIAIAHAIATVGGGYPNHSPPPYANNGNGNSAHHPNGGEHHGSNGSNYNNQSSLPNMRYSYPSTGRHQQVKKLSIFYHSTNSAHKYFITGFEMF